MYQDAWIENQEKNNEMAWLYGQYVQYAVSSCLSNNVKYPSVPLGQEERNNQENTITEEDRFVMWTDVFNARFEEKEEECL